MILNFRNEDEKVCRIVFSLSGVFAGDSGRTEKVGFKALYIGWICANMCFYYFAAHKDRPFFEYYSLKIAIICKKLSDFIIL